MGNEQSAEGLAVPETGLRLSTLCRYLAETGTEEGLSFSWFQSSTDVSGVVLRGAHRWGYVLSYVGGQRLFKDMRQRFVVLLDHYLCYFDSHTPEARMRGSIDLDKTQCHLELLPRTTDGTMAGDALGLDDSEEHRVEVSRKVDGTSMVLCFASAVGLQDWMKSIFDVQQRKATFSPLRHSDGGSSKVDDDPEWVDDGMLGLVPDAFVSAHHARNVLQVLMSPGVRVSGRRRRRRRRDRRRGTLEPSSSRCSPSRGRVPSSWAEPIQSADDSLSPQGIPSAAPSSLGKASERLARLPRGGRAPGAEGISGSMDEYGAFTTAQASIYEGWTRGLQPHGWGRMIYVNGDCVEGWWEHDMLEGSGEHTSREEGWTYRGGYVAGRRHGPGRLTTVQGDVWDCEWRHGVVSAGISGTHATLGGDVYQGGCAPSAEDREVPCRSGHGRLRRRNGEQIETQFRAGCAIDGAKGVVRSRNGAIFFGQLLDAQPHGYGELYLSSVKPETRSSSRSGGALAELEETARDVLWYKGDFRHGKAHGTGLVKYKDPPAGRQRAPAPQHVARSSSLPPAGRVSSQRCRRDIDVSIPDTSPTTAVRSCDETKEEMEVDDDVAREALDDSLALVAMTDEDDEEDEEDEDEDDASDSEEEEEEEDEEEEEEDGEEGSGRGARGGREGDLASGGQREQPQSGRGRGRLAQAGRGRSLSIGGGGGRGASLPQVGEEKAQACVPRTGHRSPAQGAEDASDGSATDMEYEACFKEGVMVRHDPAHLRLAALRFGRAEIRRLNTLLRHEEEAMSRLRSRGLCLLCNAEEMNALLVDCRHRVLCMGCAGRTDCCPVCRKRISKIVRTFST